jgi:hypothetical protein
MKLKLFLFLLGGFSWTLNAQEFNPFYQNLAGQTTQNQITEKLQQFESFGIKEMGTNAQENTMDWIIGQYQSWGYTDIQQQEVNVFGETGYNIIVTKTGTVYPDKFVIIDGHYDTINGPGVNDNGSGTSIILEAARILKNIPTEYSIKFIHFTGEEEGLIGSEKYVEQIALPQNLDIKLVLNIDEVGGVNGEQNNTITCERDEDWPNSNNDESQTVTNQLSNLMEMYSGLNTEIGYAYASDYVPFQNEGYVITGLYESNESPYPHSSEDTFQHLDPEYVYKTAKGTIGAICYFSNAYEIMSVEDSDNGKVHIFPNPANDYFQISVPNQDNEEITLTNASGQPVFIQKNFEQENLIPVSGLPNGIYFVKIQGDNLNYTSKIMIQHK